MRNGCHVKQKSFSEVAQETHSNFQSNHTETSLFAQSAFVLMNTLSVTLQTEKYNLFINYEFKSCALTEEALQLQLLYLKTLNSVCLKSSTVKVILDIFKRAAFHFFTCRNKVQKQNFCFYMILLHAQSGSKWIETQRGQPELY